MTITRPFARPLAGLLCIALLGTACGDDDSEADAGAVETSEPTGEQFEIAALDYSFENVPDSIRSGDQLTLVNGSRDEIHEVVAFRLDDEDERSIGEIAALPPDELLALVGPEPATVLLAPPEGDVIPAIGDGTLDQPGRYALICVIPIGADPDAYLTAAASSEGGPPDVEGGPPHITAGMYAELRVDP